MKIYGITAVNGHLGRAIAGAVIKNGRKDQLIGLARTPKKANDLGIEVRPGDYDEPDILAKSLEGITDLVFISGMAPADQRIVQHRHVINAAKAAGIKRVIFTSIFNNGDTGTFNPIVKSMAETEEYLKASNLAWTIGRNGLYIDADLEAIPEYLENGEIVNCAGEGKCAYVSREDLGQVYAALLSEEGHEGKIYNLIGKGVTQKELAQAVSRVYGREVVYREMTKDEYLVDRRQVHGEFLGPVIAGIYVGIKAGSFNGESDIPAILGREPESLEESIRKWKQAGK